MKNTINGMFSILFLGLLLNSQRARADETTDVLLTNARKWIDQAVVQSRPLGVNPLRIVVELGELDSRLRLAPCASVSPYLPVGAKLWGKTRLGLRCDDKASRWNVFLPLTIKAYGAAWVIKGDIQSGAVLKATDVMEAEVDWAEEASAVVSVPSQWLGQVAVRALSTGQTLRQNLLKPAQVFQAGAMVRVVAIGEGFQIMSEGQALTFGVVGQSARIKMENGRIVPVLVIDSRTVKMEM